MENNKIFSNRRICMVCAIDQKRSRDIIVCKSLPTVQTCRDCRVQSPVEWVQILRLCNLYFQFIRLLRFLFQLFTFICVHAGLISFFFQFSFHVSCVCIRLLLFLGPTISVCIDDGFWCIFRIKNKLHAFYLFIFLVHFYYNYFFYRVCNDWHLCPQQRANMCWLKILNTLIRND